MHILTRSCVLYLWIHILTFVKSQDCTLEQFVNGPHYDSNFDTTSMQASYADKKQVRVNCNIGFSGFFKLSCENGNWEPKGTKCQPRSCGHPGDAQFADFQLEKGDDFVFGSQVVYTCHKGSDCSFAFTSGMLQSYSCLCVDSSTEVKCSVPVIENGEVLGRVTEYKEHETLHFVCNPKYKPAEDRPSKCTKLGQKAEFTPTPVCEQTKCKLQLLQGTRYEPHRNVFLPGETLRVICGNKYWIVDPQSNSAEFTCGDDGNWDNDPVCKEVTCSRPNDWQLRDWKVREFRGTNWYYWRQRFSLDDTASYDCVSGYRRTGDASLAECTRSGWTPNPLCEAPVLFVLTRLTISSHASGFVVMAATCQKPELPNGFMVGPFDGKLYYTCNEDYKLLTEGWWGEAKCNSDELSELQCIDKTSCGPIPEIPNGEVTSQRTSYTDREEVEVRCERGSFQQLARLTCRQGEWQSNRGSLKETCKPPGTSCSPPPKVENAVIMTSYQKEYFSDTEVTYQCRDTHTLMGGNTIKCNKGNWEKLGTTNENISCTRMYKDVSQSHNFDTVTPKFLLSVIAHNILGLVECGRPPPLADADIQGSLKSKYSHNEKVVYTCQQYYVMEGRPHRTCSNGKWTGDLRCLKPCTVTDEAMRQRNIAFRYTYEKKLYASHNDEIEFMCTGRTTHVGTVTMHPTCIDGEIQLPTCH
uniref:coagulation factor XIII B chain-like n=1 Tax=Monopterus albus TaxID=43700 RepID=UPI0009B3FD23|nr:coagulation factor XIII B chain-like [Monopterus albus]